MKPFKCSSNCSTAGAAGGTITAYEMFSVFAPINVFVVKCDLRSSLWMKSLHRGGGFSVNFQMLGGADETVGHLSRHTPAI